MARFADKAYADLLSSMFTLQHLDAHPGSIYALDPDGRIVFVNSGWETFARDNGGQPGIAERWGVGSNYFDALAPALAAFYRKLFVRVPGFGGTLIPTSHEYECSSATLYRRFAMSIYALPRQLGHVVVNSLLVERPHDPERTPHAPLDAAYVDHNGLIHQCAHCRRVRHLRDTGRWDWVPDWVEHPQPNVSHGLCPVCMDYYSLDSATHGIEGSGPE